VRSGPPTPDPVGPGQESVWDYPRPPRLEPTTRRLRVVLGGSVIAETRRGWRVLETSHPPNYYFPPADVAPGALERVDGSSWCEFKGRAHYFTARAGDRVAPEAAWGYDDPSPGFGALRGAVAFYAGGIRVEGLEITREPAPVPEMGNALVCLAKDPDGYASLKDAWDTLKRNGIQASFGMTGQWAQQNPDLVKLIASDGHQLMNHTWDHRSWTGLSDKPGVTSREERLAELDQTEDIVHQLTGQTTLPYFRAPFGDQDASVQADVGLRGYRYDVLWTVDTRGWAGANAGQIMAVCASAECRRSIAAASRPRSAGSSPR